MTRNPTHAADAFRMLPTWQPAMARLSDAFEAGGAAAQDAADVHAARYVGARAAMIFDVVLSRQRRYQQRVVPLVERYQESDEPQTVSELADHGLSGDWGLRRGEATTIQQVAKGLASFGERSSRSEDDDVVTSWAAQADFGIAYDLDPYVGQVKGIGLALFHYLRMRCGADTLKPDVRVRNELSDLGFPVGEGQPATVYVVASAAAAEIGTTRLVLDQLLWWAAGTDAIST